MHKTYVVTKDIRREKGISRDNNFLCTPHRINKDRRSSTRRRSNFQDSDSSILSKKKKRD